MIRLFRKPPPPPDSLTVAGREVPLEIVRSARARRISLRADAVRGAVRVTLPPRAKLTEAAAFVASHRDWIAVRVARWPTGVAFAPGVAIPFDGGTLVLDWSPAQPRGVHRSGDRLLLGGARETVPGRTLRWLRAEALAAMAPATRELAAGIGRPVGRVAVRDPAGRWGSCTSNGAIGYSWRLILAPPWVRHAVVAHEVAHLVHPNHGAAFWGLAAELNGGSPAAARAWLATNGAGLHWIGRASPSAER